MSVLALRECEVGRAGRKRKTGRRHPSGKLAQIDKRPDDRVRTSRQPHRRPMQTEARLSEEAESPLGRLLLRGLLATLDETSTWPACRWPRHIELERARYEAGLIYANVSIMYAAQIGVPLAGALHIAVSDDSLPAGDEDRDDRDPDFGCAVERSGHPDACRADPDACSCRRRRERYDGAFEALMSRGQRVARTVARVIVHREAIVDEEIVYLVDGLSTLAQHFGLMARSRGSSFRNTN